MATYNIDPSPYEVSEENLICGELAHNCCSLRAQHNIFNKWINNDERKKMVSKYRMMLRTYLQLFEIFQSTETMAQMVIDNLPGVDEESGEAQIESPCQKMSNKILKHLFSKNLAEFQKAITNAFNFLYTSRRGFYCSICDQESQQFYNTSSGVITVSHEFCNDLVNNTIGFNLYRYNHLIMISRIYGQFLLTCDKNGQHTPNERLLEQLSFLQPEEYD